MRPPGGRVALWALAIALLAGGLYARSYHFDYTYLDDNLLISDDLPYLSDLGHLPRVFGRTFFCPQVSGEKYYWSLVTGSLVINAAMFGGRLTSYHATNVLLHALVSALCLLLLLRFGFALRLAVPGAAVFAVHPVLVGAVVWIPGRVYLMLGLFTIIALLGWLAWLERRRPLWLVVHLGGLAGALLCQEAAIVLPAALVLHDWLGVRPARPRRLGPLWVGWAAVLVGWFVLWQSVALSGTQKQAGAYLQAFFAHAAAPLVYLGKVVWPRSLSVLPILRDSQWLPGLVALLLVLVALWLVRPSERRWVVWGLAWFVIWIAPSLPVADFIIIESRIYVSFLGLLVAGLALVRGLGQRRLPQRWGPAFAPTAVLLVGLLAWLSWDLSAAYRDRDALTAQAVRTSPHSALAQGNRGMVLTLADDLVGAERHFRAAIALAPRLPLIRGNLGAVLLRRDRLDEAQRYLYGELSLNPGNAQAHYNLALLLQRRGQAERAVEHFELAADFNPSDVAALGELLKYYAARGDAVRAERYLRQMQALGVHFFQPPAER
ncbi:MAG: tetratricopeptide repeat protein [Proteobacteria bacterium]|nr:tetratricopeptide repeat protein [Pseudomonadota bacterium]